MNQDLIKNMCISLKRDGVDALMIAPGNDMMILTGGSPMLCERFQALVVKNDETYFYICNALYEDEITELIPGMKVYIWSDSEGFTKIVKTAFEEHELVGKTVAVNGTVRAFNLLQILENVNFTAVNGKNYPELARIIKNKDELDNLRRASRVADKVFEEIIKFIKPGMTEGDIKEEIMRLCISFGGANPECIVAVGANAAMPHYMGESAEVTENTSVEMDFGCTVGGMYSDITRTVFVGKANERQKRIYELVLKANLAGESAAVNGAFVPEVDAAARSIIEEAGYGKNFNHRLGHGIGCSVHEEPYIHGNNCVHLMPGMAFSCEPGIYIKDEIGIRIEDIVIINENGQTEVLNKCTKQLVEIPVK